MRLETSIAIVAILVLGSVLLLSGVTILTIDVIGANISNTSTIAKVYVWNTEPNITFVQILPNPIDLAPGNATTVNCTAHVFDYNGFIDINVTNATFFHESVSNGAEDDNNYHYTNNSCVCSQGSGNSPTNASCVCSFAVEYYASAGQWTCNITVEDQGGNATERQFFFNDSSNTSAVVNAVLGIEVPAEIDYGNLSVTETSSQVNVNVSNIGNVPINVSLRGYGGQNGSAYNAENLSMICDLGNISIGWERYSNNISKDYNNMTNLSYTFTQIEGFSLPTRSNDTNTANDTNTTYWRIKIPLSVGGYCNGTVEFSAVDIS